MSRSVSRHHNAFVTVYLQPDFTYEDDGAFEMFIEDLRNVITGVAGVKGSSYPSLTECNRWSGREDHVILENQRGEVSVSEYNGLVAVCLAPLDPDSSLDVHWVTQISDKFRDLIGTAYKHCVLLPLGTFSNGEQAFRPLNRPEGIVTSKEGVLW